MSMDKALKFEVKKDTVANKIVFVLVILMSILALIPWFYLIFVWSAVTLTFVLSKVGSLILCLFVLVCLSLFTSNKDVLENRTAVNDLLAKINVCLSLLEAMSDEGCKTIVDRHNYAEQVLKALEISSELDVLFKGSLGVGKYTESEIERFRELQAEVESKLIKYKAL